MGQKAWLLALFGALLFPLNATSSDRDDPEGIVTEVEKMMLNITEAINDGDLERWLAYWSNDGVQMPPSEPAVFGKSNLRDRLKPQFEQFNWDLSMTVDEVHRDGQLAFARGVFQASLLPKAGGEATTLDGKYLIVLVQDADGSWKIFRDIFNLNGATGQ